MAWAAVAASPRSSVGRRFRPRSAAGSWRRCRRGWRRIAPPAGPACAEEDFLQRRLLWPLLIGLGLALVLLLVGRDDDVIAGLARHDFARLAAKVAIGVAIGGVVLVLFRRRFSEALQAALFWTVFALLLAVASPLRADVRAVGGRVLADPIAGRAAHVGPAAEIGPGRTC